MTTKREITAKLAKHLHHKAAPSSAFRDRRPGIGINYSATTHLPSFGVARVPQGGGKISPSRRDALALPMKKFIEDEENE